MQVDFLIVFDTAKYSYLYSKLADLFDFLLYAVIWEGQGWVRDLICIRVPSHVSGMCCVFAQNHESERDTLIILSLSLSWFCAKTQRISDTWDSTLDFVGISWDRILEMCDNDPRSRMREVLAVSF